MPQRLLIATLTAVAALVAAPPVSPQTVVPVEQTPYHVPAFSNDYVTPASRAPCATPGRRASRSSRSRSS